MTTLTLLLCVYCCFASAAMAASTHQAAKLEYIYSAERPEAACPAPTTRGLEEKPAMAQSLTNLHIVGLGLTRSWQLAREFLQRSVGCEEYMVTVGIGSPAVGQTLILDTGSHVSWVRCNTQLGTPFDPTASSSYAPFSCSATACAQLSGQWNGCSQDQCQYTVSYQDGSYTAGTYSSDTLTLTGSKAITGFQFGCNLQPHRQHRRQDRRLLGLGGY
ncbi:protein ASPARTIC PROTEASE IN GUARD CELL 1-like [Aegilops tauschii subsp. strangulata]|uniref:Aspartic proteinase nepenthesin-1 n=1 Tax=Aegilops tauschii TaxID=37682 RepID=M8CM98_AEGTA